MDKEKALVFSLAPGKDFFFQSTKGSGPGGQNRNKNATAVILTHPASGVIIKASEFKSQRQNKKAALQRLVNNKKFRIWLRLEIGAKSLGYQSLEARVTEMMDEKNLKIECFSSDEDLPKSKE